MGTYTQLYWAGGLPNISAGMTHEKKSNFHFMENIQMNKEVDICHNKAVLLLRLTVVQSND